MAGIALVSLAACTTNSTATATANVTNPSATAAASGSASSVVGAVASDLLPFYTQQVSWSNCGTGFQCADINVPMNYADPQERTLKLAIARQLATDQNHVYGSLLVNPGGPGGSGIEYLRGGDVASAAVTAHYNLVGFDPRGVGQSNPVQCLSDSQMDTFLAAPPDPTTPAEMQTVVSQAQFIAQQCEAKNAQLLPYVGTVNAARDMDVLRAALGQTKLNYLGKSYGTYLGAVYAQEYPQRVGRVVLDGALDPKLSSMQLNVAQATAFDGELKQFAENCAGQTDCPMGTDPTAGVAHLKTWVDGLDAHPLPGDATRQLNEAYAMTGIAFAMYSQTFWPDLKAALISAYAGNGSQLLAMADAYNDRSNSHFQDNSTEANYAVNCLDHPDEATSVAQIQADLPAYEKAAPFFGEMVDWSGLPCAYWGTPATGVPAKLTAQGSGPILVVGTTRDPATPYAWAQGLSTELSSGHLLTMNGDGHTAYLRGSTCIDSAVDAYFLNGTVPQAGLVCQQGS
ncbi:MAG TPA: alpha/beta hydrolase [Actinocrinis sp.]|nr:alpha/beta hydrolase [Actinocrinis sp.]